LKELARMAGPGFTRIPALDFHHHRPLFEAFKKDLTIPWH
jgi:hypothetical protein